MRLIFAKSDVSSTAGAVVAFGELGVGKGRQRRYVLAMNPMIGVLRRNIVSLIRRGRSLTLRHPMDTEELVSTSGQQSVTEMVSMTPSGHSQSPPAAEGSMETAQEDRGREGEEAASITPTAGQPVSQEKKKPRQFDYSMSVYSLTLNLFQLHSVNIQVVHVFTLCRWNRRRIALKLAYLGWDYHGLAIQEPHQPTIEVGRETLIYTHLFCRNFQPTMTTSTHTVHTCFHRVVCLSVFRRPS